jgi:transposase
LDNNVAKRAIHSLALGRKNRLFMGSHEGGKSAAVVMSLVQTCRAQGINPRKYLEDVLRHLMSYPASKISELLHEAWA